MLELLEYIPQPEKCHNYPPTYIKNKPENELSFYLRKNDVASSCSNEVLACSLILSDEESQISKDESANNTNNFNLQSRLSSINTSKPVIVICHGFLSWRNQILLANLAARLSEELSCHTLRFDFTGNGHSSGTWRFADYEGNLNDLSHIVRFVEGNREQGVVGLGCKVLCVISHSQASVAMMKFRELDTHSMERLFVNLAGRLTVEGDFRPDNILNEDQCKKLKEDGEFVLTKKGHREMLVRCDDIQRRIDYDILDTVKKADLGKMLTIHGSKDQSVPVQNALRFDEVVPNHSLHIIEGADHNFNGLRYMIDITSAISSFVQKHVKLH